MARKKKTEQNETTSKRVTEKRIEKTVPIKYTFPDGVVPSFTNAFVARHHRGMFHLFFFHMNEPLILTDDPVEKRKLIDEVEFLESKCVSHVVVTSMHMQEIVNAMQRNLDLFKEKISDTSIEIETIDGKE